MKVVFLFCVLVLLTSWSCEVDVSGWLRDLPCCLRSASTLPDSVLNGAPQPGRPNGKYPPEVALSAGLAVAAALMGLEGRGRGGI